jgi:hypothetical protein
VVSPGTYSVQLRDATTNAVVGAMNFIAQGTTFYGASPPRVGWSGANGSWIFDLNSAVVNGVAWLFTTWRLCVINTAVNAQNPVVLEQLDAANNVLATLNIIDLVACQNIALLAATMKLRLSRSGLNSSADANGFGGTGQPKASSIRQR